MEQADAGKAHGNVVFVTGFNDIVITDGTTGLGNIFHATSVGTLNVVAEGEESIGA